MKTIEVTDEMYDKLIELSNEINSQDNRATAAPYFFQIQTQKRVFTPEACGNECWVSDDILIETDDEINKTIFEYKDEQIHIDDIKRMENYEKEQILEEAGWRKVNYQWEERYENAFLTEKSCREHIRLNHYHYCEPVDYLSHAFRNPDMEIIHKFLSSLTKTK